MTSWRSIEARTWSVVMPGARELGVDVLALGLEPLAEARHRLVDLGGVGRGRAEAHGVLVLEMLLDQRVENARAKGLAILSRAGREIRNHHRPADLALGIAVSLTVAAMRSTTSAAADRLRSTTSPIPSRGARIAGA